MNGMSRGDLDTAVQRAVNTAMDAQLQNIRADIERLVGRAENNAARILKNAEDIQQVTTELQRLQRPDVMVETARTLIGPLGLVTVQSDRERQAVIDLAAEAAAKKVLDQHTKDIGEVLTARHVQIAFWLMLIGGGFGFVSLFLKLLDTLHSVGVIH